MTAHTTMAMAGASNNQQKVAGAVAAAETAIVVCRNRGSSDVSGGSGYSVGWGSNIGK